MRPKQRAVKKLDPIPIFQGSKKTQTYKYFVNSQMLNKYKAALRLRAIMGVLHDEIHEITLYKEKCTYNLSIFASKI